MQQSILIVEDEADVAEMVVVNLEAEGYRCRVSGRGDDALDVALRTRPEILLLDLTLPGLDGVELCRVLRKDPRTAGAGIIMVTGRDLPGDRVAGLDAGADDYVVKPFHVEELVARVRQLIRRGRALRSSSPLTGLPGNFEIATYLDELIADGAEFALLHVDVDGFKAFNDYYGFLRGDQAIIFTAGVLSAAVDANAFVGHIGGDDLVAVTHADDAEDVARRVVEAFDAGVRNLYDFADLERGHIEVTDRTGQVRAHPFLSVSIGVASTRVRAFESGTEAASVAVELKGFAKAVSGSAWRIDRRRV
jgi:diguanylate cyclase (GGDEF)-like protein